MKPIDQPSDLKSYYRDRGVVDDYMRKRTGQPLNGFLHDRQINFINDQLKKQGANRVLELACGPGRLTAEVHGIDFGLAIDASPAMLETAQRRTRDPAWSFMRTDAFNLPFHDGSFDAVYTLRFIRHFQDDDRKRLYAELQRILRPGGVFLVDALNRDVSKPHREKKGVDSYHIYDVLYREGEVEDELRENGFVVESTEAIIKSFSIQQRLNRLRRFRIDPIARFLIEMVERFLGSQPSGWMIASKKKG